MVKQTTYRWVTAGILALTMILIATVLFLNGGFGVDPSSSARSTVEEFGEAMQQVSLTAPNATSTMATHYAPFVTPALLENWQANVKSAPGRLASTTYPARIELQSITKLGSGYIVNGEVVYLTEGAEAGRSQVILQVIPEEGRWLIAAYEEQAVEAAE